MVLSAAIKLIVLWTVAVIAIPHDTGLTSKARAEAVGRTQGEGSNAITQPISLPRSNLLFSVPDPDASTAGMGMNCKGSIMCNGTCAASMKHLQDLIHTVDDNKKFYNKQGIACDVCNEWGTAICAFTQRMKDGDFITGARVKELVDDLVNQGCTKCGNAPIDGNNVDNGEVTLNYVTAGCDVVTALCP